MPDRSRLGLVGTGWVTGLHLSALRRLDRTVLAGVVSGSADRAAAVTGRWGGTAHTDLGQMLEAEHPDAVLVCLPPDRTAAACRVLIERRVPFLTEKPLAAVAADAEAAERDLEGVDLVVAVGYNWRGLDFLPAVRERLADRPARLLVGRWTGRLPPPPWWRHVVESGGQVVEQATHLYDAARFLVGEAEVHGAASAHSPRADHPDTDVDSVAAAILRFETGAIGAFVNTSVLDSDVIELELISDGRRTIVRMHAGPAGPRWSLVTDDGDGERQTPTQRDPYEVQDEAFLDAVEARDPSRVLCTYADALATDRLVRSVVAATGSRG